MLGEQRFSGAVCEVLVTFQLPAMSGVRAIMLMSSWFRAMARPAGTPACGEKAMAEAVARV